MSDRAQRDALATELVGAWEAFVTLLGSADGRSVLGTAEAVEALLGRSILQREIEGGVVVDPEHLRAIDEQYRASAPILRDSTRLELYGSEQPAADWWWRLAEIAGQPREAHFEDVGAVAARKGVHPNTVRAAIHAGALPARRLGRGFLVHNRDVEEWEPRRRGRPAKRGQGSGDSDLDAFNAASTQGLLERAHEVAVQLARAPISARRCLALAIDRYNHGQHEESLVWLDRADELGLDAEGVARAALVRGLDLVQLGQPARAATGLAAVQAPASFRWRVRAALADALLAAGEPQEAATVVDDALQQDPNAGELRYLAARIRFHDERPAEALAHILAFRAVAPHDGPGLLLHGSILGRLADVSGEDQLYQDAINLFEQALPVEGERAHAKLALGFGRLGRWRESFSHVLVLRDVVQGEIVEALLQATLIGVAARGDIDDTNAAASYAEAHLSPTDLTRTFVALGHAVKGRGPEALRILETDVSTDMPTLPEVDCLAGLAYMSAGEPARAVARFRRFAFHPQTPGVGTVLWGYAAAAAGDTDLAMSAVHMLREDQSELGRLADLCIFLMDRHAERTSQRSVMRGGLKSFQARSPFGLLRRQSWDIEHRDVSAINERSIAAASRP